MSGHINMRSHKILCLSILLTLNLVMENDASPVNIVNKSNGVFEFIVLHNNDMHARFEQTGVHSNECKPEDAANNRCYGGFARTAHVIREYRKKAEDGGTPVLYLNAGDTYTGTPWFVVYRDNITAAFLNKLEPDAISLGNHEFDKGVNGLVPFLNEVNFPVLATNLDLSNTPSMQNTQSLKNSHVFTLDGIKVGVIGYLTPETKYLTPVNTVEFLDEIPSINAEAAKLKSEGVNIIIALGHSGFDVDQKIGEQCPDVDIVVGGHSNTYMQNGEQLDTEEPVGPYPVVVTQPGSGKQVPVVQAYAYTKYLGKLHLAFDANGNLIEWDGEPILLDHTIERDPDVLELLESYRSGILEFQSKVVGKSAVLLNGATTSCRAVECNMGNLIADSRIHSYLKTYNQTSAWWTDTAIALIQGGGIRSSIDKSHNVTYFDLMTVQPFENVLLKVPVNGKSLLDAFEHSVKNYDPTVLDGKFLQVSGVQVKYDLSRPNGERVVSLKVLCSACTIPRYENIELAKEYNVILDQFLYAGGDGYDMFAQNEPSLTLAENDLESMASYFRDLGTVYNGNEWRVEFIDTKPTDDDDSATSIATSISLMVSCLIFLYNKF